MNTLNGSRRHWCPKGSYWQEVEKENQVTNVSCLVAISQRRVVATMYIKGGAKGPHVYYFLKRVLELVEYSPKASDLKDVLIFDNARAHHIKPLKVLLREKKVDLYYCPPYSPFFNPVEFLFSKVKRELGKIIIPN